MSLAAATRLQLDGARARWRRGAVRDPAAPGRSRSPSPPCSECYIIFVTIVTQHGLRAGCPSCEPKRCWPSFTLRRAPRSAGSRGSEGREGTVRSGSEGPVRRDSVRSEHPHLLERRRDVPRGRDTGRKREQIPDPEIQRVSTRDLDPHGPLQDQRDLSPLGSPRHRSSTLVKRVSPACTPSACTSSCISFRAPRGRTPSHRSRPSRRTPGCGSILPLLPVLTSGKHATGRTRPERPAPRAQGGGLRASSLGGGK
jgi:hypothetical protein